MEEEYAVISVGIGPVGSEMLQSITLMQCDRNVTPTFRQIVITADTPIFGPNVGALVKVRLEQ